MVKKSTKIGISLCGMIIAASTGLYAAQDIGASPEVKAPQSATAPDLVPKFAKDPVPGPAEAKPVKGKSEKSWYRRLLEGIAISGAQYHTQKQDEGRPALPGNPQSR